MISLDILDIFGTLSVGIFGVIILLMAWWIYIQQPSPLWTWIRTHFFFPAPDGWMIASLLPILFGFGVIVENLTDHLTDSEKIYPKTVFSLEYISTAIPSLQARILRSEGHYRFATLFRNCEQGESCDLKGLGREYFSIHSDYLERLAGDNPRFQSFVKKPKKFLQNENDRGLDCQDQKKIATRFINKLYYQAKNWAYKQETYYDELQSIQRQIEYTRSSFLIASWGIVFVLVAFLASVVRHWRNKRGSAWVGQLWGASKLAILLVVIAAVGRMGYGHTEINFNERALGYFGSFLYGEKGNVEERASDGLRTIQWLQTSAKYTAPVEKQPPNGLRAIRWLQTSAEYTALALQTYKVAQRAVESQLDSAASNSRPPAVILDLDETVIDNSPFQVYLLKSDKTYNSDLWKSWVEDGVSQSTLIPGALSFIERMETLGVTVIYISNRRDSEVERAATIDTLKNLGVKTDGLSDRSTLRLLLKKETSGKEARRQSVEQKYNIIALIGDALGDFAEVFDPGKETTIESRRLEAIQAQEKWGDKWFVLPNPTYGAWQRILDEKAPFDQLKVWER